MNLLVVGRRQSTTSLMEAMCAGEENTVTYCLDGPAALEKVQQRGGDYDWIILENDLAACAEETAQAIRSLGCRSPISFLAHQGRSAPALAPPRLVAAFERSPKGMRLLNCVLAHPAGSSGNFDADSPPEIIFEYHAPCKKGGRNGRRPPYETDAANL